jgi:hypothetical protein
MYEKFKHPNNPYLYAWVVAPVSFLDMPTPVEARNSGTYEVSVTLDDEGLESETRELIGTKLIKDYLALLPQISNDGSLALCLLCEALDPRMTGVTEEDLAFWDEQLEAYGLGSDVWLTLEERNELMQSEEWASEVY